MNETLSWEISIKNKESFIISNEKRKEDMINYLIKWYLIIKRLSIEQNVVYKFTFLRSTPTYNLHTTEDKVWNPVRCHFEPVSDQKDKMYEKFLYLFNDYSRQQQNN